MRAEREIGARLTQHPPPTIEFNVRAGQAFVLVASREGAAPRLVIPARFTADFPLDFGHVKLTVEVDSGGVPRSVGLELRAGANAEITGGLLRKVPVAQLMREALKASANEVQLLPGGGLKVEVGFSGEHEIRAPRSGSRLTDEQLERVAETYREAEQRGHAPTQAVADQFHLARSTAARWVSKARERGMLGPAVRGRGGEAS
jgi:hypothetical protein